MKLIRKKIKKKDGFTLIEMLLVVAIIAILIAVSIPMVNTSLENARESTDMANERSAKAAITVAYMTDEMTGSGDKVVSGKTYAYDAANGKVVDASTANLKYGKSADRVDGYLQMQIDEDGNVLMAWIVNGTSVDTLNEYDKFQNTTP